MWIQPQVYSRRFNFRVIYWVPWLWFLSKYIYVVSVILWIDSEHWIDFPPHVLYDKPHIHCFGIYHLHPSRTSVYFKCAHVHAHTYTRERSIKAFRAVRGKQEKKALSKNLLTQIWFASIYPAKKGKPAAMASLVFRLPAGICHFSAVKILSHDCRVIWFNPTGARGACNTDSGLFSKGDWHAG